MSVNSVSNLSITSALTSSLQTETSNLTQLTEQLSSGQEYTDLTDYDPSDARNLVNLQAEATQKNAFISVIGTVSNNLSIYDTTLSDLENVVTEAQSLSNNNPTYSADVATNVYTQATNYLESVTADLNQDVDGRYIFSGARYTTPPVQNLANLPTSTLSTTIYTDNQTLPSYDTDYVAGASPPSTSTAAYTTDSATVDTGYTVDYGITSNDPSFQEMVAGLRYLQAAGSSTDSADYKTNMEQASTLLSSALSNIENVHTTVADNIDIISSEKTAQQTAISNLTNQVDNIQQVDVTQVSTEITALETTLQASYSVTGSILKMSIVSYL
jgi:flagellar hook-associated protein 3 FlgL